MNFASGWYSVLYSPGAEFMRKILITTVLLAAGVSLSAQATTIIIKTDEVQAKACRAQARLDDGVTPSLAGAHAALQNQNYALAEANLKPLADSIPEAARLYGTMLVSGRPCVKSDAEKGEAYLRKAIEAKDYAAAEILAYYYDQGKYLTQNDKEAFRLYTISAEGGDVTAAVNLGAMYANGRGVARDRHLGLKWAVHAAESGRPMALANIARAYMNGEVLPKDPAKAYFWISAAADRIGNGTQAMRDHVRREQTSIALALSVDGAKKIAESAKSWAPGPGSLDSVLKDELHPAAVDVVQDSPDKNATSPQ